MKLFRDYEKTAYYASADGKIWSLRKRDGRWRELKPGKNCGYLRFVCCQNGKHKNIYVHRAIWQAFNGPIPEGYELNHKNCIRTDNRLENLELVTRLQNNRYAPTCEHRREATRWKMKSVLDVTTGIVYESMMEAARQLGLNSGSISACCNGHVHHVGGHQFRYTETLPESELIKNPAYVDTQISTFIDLYVEELSGK